MRYSEKDKIIVVMSFDKQIEFNFYYDRNLDEEYRKIVRAIFELDGTLEQVKNAMMEQLKEVEIVGRTELVKEVFIEVSEVYYPSGNSGHSRPSSKLEENPFINMDFFTEYVIQRETNATGEDTIHGFYCSSTIGRFDRKEKKFGEISNSMLSRLEML